VSAKAKPTRRQRAAAKLSAARTWLRGRFDGEHFTENLALIAVAVLLVTSIDTRQQADTATTAAADATAAARDNTEAACQRARAATASNTLPYAVFDPDGKVIRPEDEQQYIERLLQLRDTVNVGLARDCANYGQPPNIDLIFNAKLREITGRLTPTAAHKRRQLKPVPVETVTPAVATSARASGNGAETGGDSQPPDGNGRRPGGGTLPQPPAGAQPPAGGASPPSEAQPGRLEALVGGVGKIVQGVAQPVCDLVRPVADVC
jgi:hypothetical protein